MAKKKKKTESRTPPKLSGKFPGLGGKREATFPVDELAKQFGVSEPALAGMKTAYEWNSETRMPRADFEAKVRAWLKAPADRR